MHTWDPGGARIHVLLRMSLAILPCPRCIAPPLSLEYLGHGQLPMHFEAEARRDPDGTADVLQLVSGRTPLGRVRARQAPDLLEREGAAGECRV